MLDFVESFQIAVLFRTDLTRAGLTFEQIEDMTNMDMEKIARKMSRLYLEGGFLSHLEQAVNEVLLEKEHTNAAADQADSSSAERGGTDKRPVQSQNALEAKHQ